MDKIEIRNMPLPDLSVEASLKKAQDDLRALHLRMKQVKAIEGILAEIEEHKYANHD